MLKARFEIKTIRGHYDEVNDCETEETKTKFFDCGRYQDACAYYEQQRAELKEEYRVDEAFSERDSDMPEFSNHYCDFALGVDHWLVLELNVRVFNR